MKIKNEIDKEIEKGIKTVIRIVRHREDHDAQIILRGCISEGI